jgi:hypothetical protein
MEVPGLYRGGGDRVGGARISGGGRRSQRGAGRARGRGLLATPLATPDGEWVTFTPRGHYVGSPGCASIYAIVDRLARYELDEVADVFHRPDLVAASIASG